jgi:diguanylate cyclase (GGDEF)-like protein
MKAQRLRYTPFILGALTVLTLASVLIRVRYDLQLTRETTQVRDALTNLSEQLSTDLDRALIELQSSDQPAPDKPWHRWTLSGDGKTYTSVSGDESQIPQSTLQAELERHDIAERVPLLLGPFATERSGNALAIALSQKGPDGSRRWIGASAPIDALINPTLAGKLLKAGYRLQLSDLSRKLSLYQSDEGNLSLPVTLQIRFAGTDLRLAASPREGWKPTARWWSSTLLILLAVILWLSFELRRGHILRDAADDLQEAEERRKQANELYGKAIENVSALESRLQVVSMYDTVTGLANRSSLIRRIESALETMRQAPNGSLAILAIGFDHMHHITNSFGADFASRVLVIAAERVEFVLPSRDLLYRIGDLQLAIVLPNVSTGASVALSNKIVAEIEAPISLDSHTFMLHPSIGIAETTSGYEYPEALLDQANTALGAVQRDVISRYCIFDSRTAKEAVGRLQLEVDLSRAFEEQQFVLEYEPIVLPVTNEVAGFEALIRWNHPTEGRISPGRFVPIAVQAGMAHRLNSWVMREAARQAAEWRRAGYRNLFINFNLSAEAFLRPRLDEEIGDVLAEFDLPGNCLVVELTESALIQDLRAAARILQRLSELGLKAWLDDFGTGYSSLSYLRALPLRGVKIDRSFVERTVLDARDFGFLKSLIDLISYLGMQSIAEGIETREQYELLSMTTCDMYQGWHFAHSMPAAEAERWMNDVGGAPKLVRRA